MAGIVGIARQGEQETVVQMAERLSHRGPDRAKLLEKHGITMEAVWPDVQDSNTPSDLQASAVWDGTSTPAPNPDALRQRKEPFALAAIASDELFLARDPLGVRPLYYSDTGDGLAFASEVKALLPITQDVYEFPPGAWYSPSTGFRSFSRLTSKENGETDPVAIASELRARLEDSIQRRITADEMGSWLSGGLDSSAIAALARPHVKKLYTFVSGVDGAPDLEYASRMADHIEAEHHELRVTLGDLLAALPEVIYHLESFDALLVRSTITNYLTAKMVSDYVNVVFSGEGGDELFAGYDYIKQIPEADIPAELEDITGRLHNTALQRVDRSAQAHGVVPLVPFLDMDVAKYAFSIPARYKLNRENTKPIEKWILRKAVEDLVPENVLWRAKSKFWQGAGVKELLAEHAEQVISHTDFANERTLSNGWRLNSKEELMYYRIFREHFGELQNLDWMGRTKGAPVH